MKKVFLGGTCNGSRWRDRLIPLLDIDYFNPVVEEWNDKAQQEEMLQRENCDYCLYVLTPKMEGVYSVAEVVDDSNKRPDKTIFCFLPDDEDEKFSDTQLKSIEAVKDLVKNNDAKVCNSLNDVAQHLNKKNKVSE